MIKNFAKNQSFTKLFFEIQIIWYYLYVKLLKFRMMKKLFLLSATCAISAMSASAQYAERGLVKNFAESAPAVRPNHAAQMFPMMGSAIKEETNIPNTGKATASGSRWYSYVEYLTKVSATVADSADIPYTWGKANAKAIFSDGSGGFVADTINLASFGITFDPAFSAKSGFNEATIYDPTLIGIRRTDNYTIDSVSVFTSYGRNNLKTTSVDTLRVTITYGNGTTGSDLPLTTYTGTGVMGDFGVDTLKVWSLLYDSVKMVGRGATKVTKDIYLKNTDTSSFVKAYSVAVGMNVPAGNVVGVTATFFSGETYTPYVDTVFYGSLRPANPFGMGMIRPRIFADATNTLNISQPNYIPNFYNRGFIKFIPQLFDAAFYTQRYVPTIIYVDAFSLEFPDIDVKVSCTACKTVGELSGIDNSTIITRTSAFPNPANTEVTIPFTVKEKANVKVSITNMVGQVIATQNIDNVGAGQEAKATFATGNLATGVYLYTVESNGQRVSNRFSVAH